MAMRKLGRAAIAEVYGLDYGRKWDGVRTAAKAARLDGKVLSRVGEILGEEFDPRKYLLSHATIVCSVDTEAPRGARTGAVEVDGKKVNRKTASFRVTSRCDRYINNNHECWSRGVILKSYPTFIGANSYVEHVQKEELAKGKVLDAVARDVGESVYIDILVANDRKHKELCADILSGKMSTLSMGCLIDGSTCTKCGNWAADETEMCDHMLWEKGNYFFDERGERIRIAELCGDESLEPTGGNRFNDASWVGTPAFEGAVNRGTLDVLPGVVSRPTKEQMKAAALAIYSEGGESRTAAAASEESPDYLGQLKAEVMKLLVEDLKADLAKKREPKEPEATPDPTAPNDSLIKQGDSLPQQVQRFAAASKTPLQMVRKIRAHLSRKGVELPLSFYRAILRFGTSRRAFSDERQLYAFVGRELTGAERRLFKLSVRLSRTLSNTR